MGLDSVDTKIYVIHGYFHKLKVDQRTPKFLGCHRLCSLSTLSKYVLRGILHLVP